MVKTPNLHAITLTDKILLNCRTHGPVSILHFFRIQHSSRQYLYSLFIIHTVLNNQRRFMWFFFKHCSSWKWSADGDGPDGHWLDTQRGKAGSGSGLTLPRSFPLCKHQRGHMIAQWSELLAKSSYIITFNQEGHLPRWGWLQICSNSCRKCWCVSPKFTVLEPSCFWLTRLDNIQ